MRIVVLDDDSLARRNCLELLEKYASDHRLQVTVSEYASEEDMLKGEADQAPDVAFLDIRMGTDEEDGIQAAARINRMWPDCHIVYVTDYVVYVSDVYRTRHTYFVLKDRFQERIEELFDIILKKKAAVRKITFDCGRKKVTLSPKEIIYFERSLRITKMVTKDPEYILNEKLSALEEMLPEGLFCRCHTSYLINLNEVREMHRKEFILKGGRQITISRMYQQSARDEFLNWVSR